MLARGWRRGPLAVARTSWLQTPCMMLSSVVPPETKTMKPYYSIEKQHLVLQVLQAMHDEAGRPNPFVVKSWFRVPCSDKYPPELHEKRLDISHLRADKHQGLLDAEVEAKLDVMGLVWDFAEFQWNKNKRALETYKRLHGDLLVPSDYAVPTDDLRWPVELWSKQLGVVVASLRTKKATLAPDKKQWLDAMGFVWDAMGVHWELNLLALQTYKAIHGDLLVPTAFVVPRCDPMWPQHLWGRSLGTVVHALRHKATALPPQRRSALNDMEFIWRLREPGDGVRRPRLISIPKQRDFVQVVQTQRCQQVHKKFVTLPKQFVVPHEDPWPPTLRGVGFNVSAFRRAFKDGRLQPSVVEDLDAMGFVWSVKDHRWNLNMEALTIYKALHDDLLVPSDFSIPHNDPRWPVYLRGKHLGSVLGIVRQVRTTLTSAEQDQLDSIGFVWDPVQHHWQLKWQLHYVGLQTFKDLYGHVNIPNEFIVPDQDPAWPPKLWNVKLGSFFHRVRSGTRLTNEQRQDLDALGFLSSVLDTQWERNLQALETFQAIHGHLRVPQTFAVPEHDPLWPQQLWNLKLGIAVQNIRRRSQRPGYPASRLGQLTKIGFFPATHVKL